MPQITSRGFIYIENLTWVHLAPNHAIDCGPGDYFSTCHTSLYMFRRPGVCCGAGPAELAVAA